MLRVILSTHGLHPLAQARAAVITPGQRFDLEVRMEDDAPGAQFVAMISGAVGSAVEDRDFTLAEVTPQPHRGARDDGRGGGDPAQRVRQPSRAAPARTKTRCASKLTSARVGEVIGQRDFRPPAWPQIYEVGDVRAARRSMRISALTAWATRPR